MKGGELPLQSSSRLDGASGGRGGSGGGGGRGLLPRASSSAKLDSDDVDVDDDRSTPNHVSPSSSSLPRSSADGPGAPRRKSRDNLSSVKGNWTQEEDDRLQKCVGFH